MSLITSTRLRQENIINQNLASIVITRKAKVSDGAGGWITSTSTLASQDVRIYAKQSRTLSIDDGGWHSERVIKMLCKYNADVKAESANNKDMFTYGTKTYKIYSVKDVYTGGSIVFKEAEIIEL